MSNAEAEYKRVKELIETLRRVCKEKDRVGLDEAEAAMQGNSSSPELLKNLEHNLLKMRQRILSESAATPVKKV